MQLGNKTGLFRRLPSVDELLRTSEIIALVSADGAIAVTEACRVVLARLREEIANGHLDSTGIDLALSGMPEAVARELRRALSYSLRPVINATGVVLHTNLGRAPIAESALEHLRHVAVGYSNLEYHLTTGERGKRDAHTERLFRKLLSPHDQAKEISTIVVNNNAAGVLLALNTLAEGAEVIVSRGELVEIGGSFRIPDVMSKSGAKLCEVGTTNRTRIADYERAINDRTRLLLRVHRSNFEITGFTEQPPLEDLVDLARKKGLPLMEDLGSGALFDFASLGVNREPGVLESLRSGVDVVTYSGDKLLGGPQAGILSGRSDLILRMRSNSLFRALRVDKLTCAALEATLLVYLRRDFDALPILRMMKLSRQEIAARAHAVAGLIASGGGDVELLDGESIVGGGAAPSAVLPTSLLAITSKNLSADELASRLRASHPPVIARVEDGRVLLDLRTVFPEQDQLVAAAVNKAAENS